MNISRRKIITATAIAPIATATAASPVLNILGNFSPNRTAKTERKKATIRWTREMHNDGYIFTLRGDDKTDANSYALTYTWTGQSDDTYTLIKHVLNG